jgi:superfamily II DNA or RNA helicase
MDLRPYQIQARDQVYAAWDRGARVVGLVLGTGAGKTVIFSDIVSKSPTPVCVIAHRQELVRQISLALARAEVRHRVYSPRPVIRTICQEHMRELGESWYDPRAPVAVAGVDTLIRADLGPWADQVGLWVQDECHHVLRKNKWGAAANLFANARGLGVTATPCRADGCGLGSHTDGLIDELVVGPSVRDLIDQGYLCDYRIFNFECEDLNLKRVGVGATGDYKRKQLDQVVRESRIVGDVVDHYLRHAAGKRGVTFATSVRAATDIARAFVARGVPAEVVSAKTQDALRTQHVQRLASGELLQLVNVDLFGEGFDLPAIECVSFARPTQSYAVYAQQFGRALRPMTGKGKAIILDHVGNTIEHNGPPDVPRVWSLERRQKRPKAAGDEIPIKGCPKCGATYERIHKCCPYCGDKPEPVGRDEPKQVDGDLTEVDPQVLDALRKEAARIVGEPRIPAHLPPHAQAGARKQQEERQQMQFALRASLSQWVSYRREEGRSISESYRLFFFRYGVDMATARTLGAKDARVLADKVNRDIGISHAQWEERQ